MKPNGKIIDIIGVPSDFGANVPGSLMGPDAIRSAGIHSKLRELNKSTIEKGNIVMSHRFQISEEDSSYHYLKVIQKICQDLKSTCLDTFKNNHLPLVLGGDHSIAIGSLAATCEHFATKKIGLLWVDTHPDFNTPETSHTGNIHGMPLSLLFGKGYANLLSLFNNQKTIQPENTVLIGLRDIDTEEKQLLKRSGVTFYTMRDIDEKGIKKVLKEVFKSNFKDLDGLHLSFDYDVMNPAVMPGVSTPVQGGLTLREAHLLLEMLHETQNIVAADFVELNPINDIQGQSAIAASELICSLFGKSII